MTTIHPDTIEEVKQRADIVEIISEYVVLKKRGKDYQGLCPFHQEKTPSFTVNPNKQMYYCFGCQSGGNVVGFLRDFNKQSFSEVILDLARRYQIPVKTLDVNQTQELQKQFSLRDQLYEILAIATDFYQHILRQSQGQNALDYITNIRGFTDTTIQQFKIGYAPAGWETIYNYLVEVKKYPVQLVEQTGLIVPRKEGNGYYDRFRDRLLIPICDLQGRVIGFGGRTLSNEEPKYLNSPETELFNKGQTLFALDQANRAITVTDKAIVVEGYFDAIALHQVGIKNVVASLGTALSSSQIKLILRYTESKQIILNFDADQAGNKAAERAIGEIANLAYLGQIQLKILTIPSGKDADEFLKETGDKTAYEQLINDAPLWINWQIQKIIAHQDMNQADIFQKVNQEMVKLLANINNDTLLMEYINSCAEILSQGDKRQQKILVENLTGQIANIWKIRLSADSSLQVPQVVKNKLPTYNSWGNSKQNTPSKKPPIINISGESDLLKRSESLLLRLYIYCPDYRSHVIFELEEREIEFSLSHHRFLWQKILEIQHINENSGDDLEQLSSEELISKLYDYLGDKPEYKKYLLPILNLDELTEKDLSEANKIIKSAVNCIERVMKEKESREHLKKWQETDPTTQNKDFQFYHQEFYKLKERIKKLDIDLDFHYFCR